MSISIVTVSAGRPSPTSLAITLHPAWPGRAQRMAMVALR